MLGLEGYSSSDDEEAEVAAPQAKESTAAQLTSVPQPDVAERIPQVPAAQPSAALSGLEDASNLPLGPLSGPTLPPQTTSSLPSLPDADASSLPPSAPSSPYTSARSLTQSLTLPTHSNTNIPPSPPGSPRPSTTSKIRKFLDLKARGVHFNEKLASSSALANPELLGGLLEFAGVGREFEQYATVLPDEIAVVRRKEGGKGVEGVYWEELNRIQERIGKRREEERRGGKREFVKEGEGRDGGEGKRRKG